MPVRGGTGEGAENAFEADMGEWMRDSEIFLQQLDLVMCAEFYE